MNLSKLLFLIVVKAVLASGCTNSINSAKQWNDKGNAFFNQSKYDQAIDAYNKSLSINPKDTSTWILIIEATHS